MESDVTLREAQRIARDEEPRDSALATLLRGSLTEGHVTEGNEGSSYEIFYQMFLIVSESEVVKGQGKTRVKVTLKFCWVNRKSDRERWTICCRWNIQSSLIVPRSNSASAATMAIAPGSLLTESQPAHALTMNSMAGFLSSMSSVLPSEDLCHVFPVRILQPMVWKWRVQGEQLTRECLLVNRLSATDGRRNH